MAGGVVITTGRSTSPTSRLTWQCLTIGILAGCGGALFGYDLGIAGGVASMDPFLADFFPGVLVKKADAQAGAGTTYCKFDDRLLQVRGARACLSAHCDAYQLFFKSVCTCCSSDAALCACRDAYHPFYQVCVHWLSLCCRSVCLS